MINLKHKFTDRKKTEWELVQKDDGQWYYKYKKIVRNKVKEIDFESAGKITMAYTTSFQNNIYLNVRFDNIKEIFTIILKTAKEKEYWDMVINKLKIEINRLSKNKGTNTKLDKEVKVKKAKQEKVKDIKYIAYCNEFGEFFTTEFTAPSNASKQKLLELGNDLAMEWGACCYKVTKA